MSLRIIPNSALLRLCQTWHNRKNWLFVGNDHGGEVAALINSLVVTCKDNGVDFEAWLLDVLPRLATTPSGDIDTLLPHVWKPLPKQD